MRLQPTTDERLNEALGLALIECRGALANDVSLTDFRRALTFHLYQQGMKIVVFTDPLTCTCLHPIEDHHPSERGADRCMGAGWGPPSGQGRACPCSGFTIPLRPSLAGGVE